MHPTDERAPHLAGRPDRPRGARRLHVRSSIPAGTRIGVLSDLALVAETVAAALIGRGMVASVLPWAQEAGRSTPPPDWGVPAPRSEEPVPDLVLMICGLGSPSKIAAACERGKRCVVPWVVMADSRPGPAWGAVLEAGARAVVLSTISLTDLEEVLGSVLRGESPIGVAERIALLREWWSARTEREQLSDRMRSLSPREQVVLSMLYEGTTVRAIADRLEVSEATVRSQVKAVLRKLSVASQLAAVAAVGEFRDDDRSD